MKYSDLRYLKGEHRYGILIGDYKKIKDKEGIEKESEFKFTLYKNDLILIKDTAKGKEELFRFWSRTGKDNAKTFEKNKIELKPYSKSQFKKGEDTNVLGKLYASSNQLQKSFGTLENLSIYKVRTDVLGNKYFIKKEGDQPQLNFKKKL